MYTERLLRHLPRVASENQYLAFVGKDAPPLPEVQLMVSPLPTQHPAVRIAWEQSGFPLWAALCRTDVVHGTVNVLPLARAAPGVVTVHDLSFLRYPETFPRAKAQYLRYAVTFSARSARRVIAVSESTRRDLIELARVREDRVEVVYSGVDERFRPLTDGELGRFRSKTFGGRPYILHVGTLQPRKNVNVLIRAFAQLKSGEHIPHKLALVGARGWMYQRLFDLVQDLGLSDDVSFVDYVHQNDLPLWYNCADVFTYPSVYEGFGLPILEAMACGTPVVTSASSSLLEVVGEAGITVEPGSDEALAHALSGILNDSARRDSLRAAGLRHAQGWTWDATARETARIYEIVREDA